MGFFDNIRALFRGTAEHPDVTAAFSAFEEVETQCAEVFRVVDKVGDLAPDSEGQNQIIRLLCDSCQLLTRTVSGIPKSANSRPAAIKLYQTHANLFKHHLCRFVERAEEMSPPKDPNVRMRLEDAISTAGLQIMKIDVALDLIMRESSSIHSDS
jgi:hypothetical protein